MQLSCKLKGKLFQFLDNITKKCRFILFYFFFSYFLLMKLVMKDVKGSLKGRDREDKRMI